MDSFSYGTGAPSPLTFKKVVAFAIGIYILYFILSGNLSLLVALIKLVWAGIVWLVKGYAFLFPLIGTAFSVFLLWCVIQTDETLESRTTSLSKEIATLRAILEELPGDQRSESDLLRRVITQMKTVDDRLRKLEPIPVETQESMNTAVEQFMEPR